MDWQSKDKASALASDRFYPDMALMSLNNPFTHSQFQTIAVGAQATKRLKETLAISGRDIIATICHSYAYFSAYCLDLNQDLGPLWTALRCIFQHIRETALYLDMIDINQRKGRMEALAHRMVADALDPGQSTIDNLEDITPLFVQDQGAHLDA